MRSRPTPSRPDQHLTERELEVLRPPRPRAEQPGDRRRARDHRANGPDSREQHPGKLDLRSRTQAALFAVEHRRWATEVGRFAGAPVQAHRAGHSAPVQADRTGGSAPLQAHRAAPDRDGRPLIVLLHPTRLTGASWSPIANALGDEFRCLTPDLPGHGRAASRPFTLELAARQVSDLIAADGAGGPAILVGLSLGGYVAMEVAVRRPDLVARRRGSRGVGRPDRAPGRRVPSRCHVLRAPSPSRSCAASIAGWSGWRFRPASRRPDPRRVVSAFRGGAVALRATRSGGGSAAAWRRIPGRVLLINGEFDLFFRPTERSFAPGRRRPAAARCSAARPTSRNLEQPGEFALVIRRFAARSGGRRLARPDRDNPGRSRLSAGRLVAGQMTGARWYPRRPPPVPHRPRFHARSKSRLPRRRLGNPLPARRPRRSRRRCCRSSTSR